MAAKRQRTVSKRRRSAAIALGAAVALAAFAFAGTELARELPGSRREAATIALDVAFGATVEPLDFATARSLGITPGCRGLVVTSVATDGPAARAGIRAGDVIERFAGKPIDSPVEAAALLKAARLPLALTLNRRGNHAIVWLPIRSTDYGDELAKQGDEG